jgi:DNA-directed RNA polymerase specialized sigma24 family protein
MFRTEKPEPANLRSLYATRDDFCNVLEHDMKPLYLLAFLLTGNHGQAEQCFASTVESAFEEKAVFKEWAQSWVKRSLIKNAIRMVFAQFPGREKHDPWSARQDQRSPKAKFDAVTKLAPLERFVFVMSILERYSTRDCSLLLSCGFKEVARAQTRAVRQLSARDEHFGGIESYSSDRLQAIA